MNNSFYALIFRQKHIRRWGLMRNLREESLAEHSAQTAVLAHALALIGNRFFGENYDAERATVLALFHDTTEVYTGDLPTPIKYFSPEMRENYREIEKSALCALLRHLPDELAQDYENILDFSGQDDKKLEKLVKAADKLSALIKCLEEEKGGNSEFLAAARSTKNALLSLGCKEAEYFVDQFLPTFLLTLDEMQEG